MDFASEQLVMTNYYTSWNDVSNIGLIVDRMNGESWPKNATNTAYGPLAWKIVGFNWSFKQQSSGQQRLEYYEVQVTFKRSILWKYMDGVHILQGFPPAVEDKIKAGTVGIPATLPMIASAGFQERDGNDLSAISVDVKYYDCAGQPVDPPNDPDQPPNSPCVQWPVKEPTTEEMPLDKDGKACPPDTPGAIIVPWTEEYPLVDFIKVFGDGPPYKPKATTT
jgi:hypothetical protein